MSSNQDVVLEIRKILANLPVNIKFEHVEAHVDDDIPYDELTVPQKLKTNMDKLTKRQNSMSILEHLKLMPHLPEQIISLKANGYRLTQNIPAEFSRLWHDYLGEIAALEKWKINPKDANLVDWTALEFNFSQWNKRELGSAIKCIHRQWDTMQR